MAPMVLCRRSNDQTTMASFNKGQLPAQQTKVVDHGLGPIKAGPTVCVSRFVTMMVHPQRLVSVCMNVVLFVVMLLIRLIT